MSERPHLANRLVMLAHGGAELVVAVRMGDEIQERYVGREERGFDAGNPG